jgi:hypothetical protein
MLLAPPFFHPDGSNGWVGLLYVGFWLLTPFREARSCF